MEKEQVSITAKLLAIQCKLKAPKGRKNEFAKFNYRNASDILEAVKPLNAEAGVLLTLSDDVVQVGERFYLKATATLTDGVSSVQTTALAREAKEKKGMDDSQVSGMASSYARKYALCGLYAIDDTDDADTMDNRSEGNAAKPKARAAAIAKPAATQSAAHQPTEREERVALAIADVYAAKSREQLVTLYNRDYADVVDDARVKTAFAEAGKKYPDESKRKASAAHS